MYNKEEKKYIMAASVAILLTIFIIIFSEDAFKAALEGLRVWWEIVFPSLLPFFIISEILMGLGVVHLLGALLEPLMRPVFNVPGVGAFALAMGLASGYPIGAKITGNLRRKKLCTKTEAERLVSFTNTADPLFMVGAIAVGMFHRPELGIVLATAHYISSILVGFILRFYKGEESEKTTFNARQRKTNIFSKAIFELVEARKKDGRSIGELLGDSIKESVNTLLMVGGFIIVFSVITGMFISTGLITNISKALMLILKPLGLSETVILPLISGFFEVTNGANLISQAQAPLLHQVIVTNAIIAWSGLSVLAQVATMVNDTDIKLKPYIFSRILQSIIAGILTIFLLPSGKIETVFSPILRNYTTHNGILLIFIIFFAILSVSLAISLIIYLLKKLIPTK